jgi:hypothetical protein
VWACDEREGRGLERSGLKGFLIQVLSNNYGYEAVEIAAGGDSTTLEDATRDTVKLVESAELLMGRGWEYGDIRFRTRQRSNSTSSSG